jgi:hypothetical protein
LTHRTRFVHSWSGPGNWLHFRQVSFPVILNRPARVTSLQKRKRLASRLSETAESTVLDAIVRPEGACRKVSNIQSLVRGLTTYW